MSQPWVQRADENTDARRPPLGLAVLVGFVVAIVGATVAVGVVSATGWGDPTVEGDLPTSVAGIVGLWVGFIGVPLLWARMRKERVGELFGLRAQPADLRFALLGAFMQVPVLATLYWLLFQLVGVRDLDPEAAKMVDGSAGVWLWVLGVVFVIGAPIAEELFFRGLVQRAVAPVFRTAGWLRAWGPILVSSVVFAVTHLQPWKLPGLVVLALLLGWLAQRHNRLGPSIAVHMGFNAVAFALLVVDRVAN